MQRLPLFSVFFLCSLSEILIAEEKPLEIIVTGNERTRSAYVERLAKACLSDLHEKEIAAEEQELFLSQCLMNAKIFAKVDTRLSPGKLEVGIEEKWTLIPAPFYQSSGSTRKGGIILFETNFLGQGLTLALGGNTSNRGSGFFGFFSNPSIAGSSWFSHLSLAKEATIYELIERREDVSYTFLEKSLGGSASLGYRFPWLNISGNIGRTMRKYEEQEGYAPPKAYSLNRAGISLDFDRRDYKLYFSDGLSARYRFSRSFAETDDAKPIEQHDGSISWQHDVYRDHALYLMASALSIKGGRVVDAERVGSTKGFRGIESRTAFASSYFVQSVEYQIPLQHFEKGTLTSAVFADHGRIENRGGTSRTVDYSAGGVGVYFYFSRIALPGFGLEWGANSEYQKSFVNFSVGMSY